MTLSELHRRARLRLAVAGIDTPDLDARLLVEHFSSTGRADLVLRPELAIDGKAVDSVEAALARRCAGEPVHRIFGFREFYGLRLELGPETLEPRPDTETLVDAMIPLLRNRVAASGGCRLLDLGTGTGALALALLAAVPEATAVASDISYGALAVATRNARALGLEGRFEPVRSDWWENIRGRYDAIVSNPPYISHGDIASLAREVRDFDPIAALDGGPDGLDAYRTIAEQADEHLADGGLVGLEIGAGQADDVEAIFSGRGIRLVTIRRDFGGHDRAMIFRR